jgi:hypothetical protein
MAFGGVTAVTTAADLEKRMGDRTFAAVDLRLMLERVTAFRPDVIDGRFVLETRFRAGGVPIGLEITAPSAVTVSELKGALT